MYVWKLRLSKCSYKVVESVRNLSAIQLVEKLIVLSLICPRISKRVAILAVSRRLCTWYVMNFIPKVLFLLMELHIVCCRVIFLLSAGNSYSRRQWAESSTRLCQPWWMCQGQHLKLRHNANQRRLSSGFPEAPLGCALWRRKLSPVTCAFSFLR